MHFEPGTLLITKIGLSLADNVSLRDLSQRVQYEPRTIMLVLCVEKFGLFKSVHLYTVLIDCTLKQFTVDDFTNIEYVFDII